MDHKPQIELLDVVTLTAPAGRLPVGSLGTVVEVLSDDAFMVEFIDDQGYTLAIETLRRDCLRRVWSKVKEELITYTVEVDGETYVVKDVPVRMDEKTGEPFFAPDTVDRLQEILEKQMEEREDAEWQEFAYRSFAAGYDADEPDYSVEDIKDPPAPDEPAG